MTCDCCSVQYGKEELLKLIVKCATVKRKVIHVNDISYLSVKNISENPSKGFDFSLEIHSAYRVSVDWSQTF